MEGSDRELNGNEQRTPRQMLIDEVNHYATLYAQVRKKAEAEGRLSMEEVHAKLSNHEHLLKAWTKAFQLFKQGKNEHYYYYAGEKRYDLGEDGMNFSIEILKLLNRYDPDIALFTTFLERRVERMHTDYLRRVQRQEIEIGGIDGSPDEDDKPINEPGAIDTGYEMVEEISAFERLSEMLYRHIAVVDNTSERAKTKRKRFFAYHTRSYVLICEDFTSYVRWISEAVDKTLSQPYILYLQREKVKNNKAAEEYLDGEGKGFHVGAIRLRNLCLSGKLIRKRYEEKQAMNIYFDKKNLSTEMKEYERLLDMFMKGET